MRILIFSLFKFLGYTLLITLLLSCANKTTTKSSTETSSKMPRLDLIIPQSFIEQKKDISIPSLNTVFELTEEQQLYFLKYMNRSKEKSLGIHQKLAKYLQQFSQDFSYQGATLNAQQAFEQRQGNCLSLAILTTALSRLVAVEVNYQKVFSEPIYQKDNNIIIRGDHVRSKLIDPNYKPKPGILTLFPPMVIVDYFPELGGEYGGPVSEEDFHAMIYSNFAAEEYVNSNYLSSFYNALEALKYNERYGPALNTLALTLNKLNDKKQTEKVFLWTIEHATDIAEPLGNYIDWLEEQGRQSETPPFVEKLLALDQPNPFDFIARGNELFKQGAFKQAERMFLKAQKIAPYLHHSYNGLALIKIEQGRLIEAKELLKQGLDKSYSSESRNIIRDKLKVLTVQ